MSARPTSMVIIEGIKGAERPSIHSSNMIRPRKNVHAWNNFSKSVDNNLYNNNKTPIFHISDGDGLPGGKDVKEVKKKKPPNLCKKLLQYIDNYCDNSTLHGLKYVGDNKLSIIERLFWLISFLTAIAFAAYFIDSLYQKYDTSPVIVSFSPTMTNIDSIPFPAITICNVNIATRDRAEEIRQSGTDVEKRLLDDMCEMTNATEDGGTAYEATANWKTVRNFVISINQRCEDMFKVCLWENRPVSCDDYINSILTDEGYCCSFNRLPSNYSLRNAGDEDLNQTYPSEKIDWNPENGYPEWASETAYPLRSFGAGAHLGLTLVLDADLEQYYCTSTNSVGFKVKYSANKAQLWRKNYALMEAKGIALALVEAKSRILLSNPIETPKIADFGFLVSPGVESRMTIKPTILDSTQGIAKIDVKKRQCFFTRERYLQFYRTYSERNCRLECQANYTLKMCRCVPYFLPKNITTRICDKRKEKCVDDAKYKTERFTKERTECNCLPGCHEMSYDLQSMSSGALTIENNNTIGSDFKKNITQKYFVENIVVAKFFYSSDKFMKQTKSELYGFSEFLSNTGGLLGLFMGFSFLSAVEIFYFFILKSARNLYKAERKKNAGKRAKVTKQVSALPFTQ